MVHGGGQERLDIGQVEIAAEAPDEELFAIHETIDRFAAHDAQKAELVKLRYFAGLSVSEAAAVLSISPRSADRLWAYARAYLHEVICNA